VIFPFPEILPQTDTCHCANALFAPSNFSADISPTLFLVAVTKGTDSSLPELSFQKWIQNNNPKKMFFSGEGERTQEVLNRVKLSATF